MDDDITSPFASFAEVTSQVGARGQPWRRLCHSNSRHTQNKLVGFFPGRLEVHINCPGCEMDIVQSYIAARHLHVYPHCSHHAAAQR